MLALEKLHQFLSKARELSVMFSPWWTRRSSDTQQQLGNQPERLLRSRKKCASVRLSTSVTQDFSELGNMKSSKKKTKHKQLKSKQHSISEITKCNKSQLRIVPVEVEPIKESSGKKKKESCRVINLKIPLPDDAALLLSRHYYYNPCNDYPPLPSRGDSAKSLEDGATRKPIRKKASLVARSTAEQEEQQTTLKSVELVSSVAEDQLVNDVYSQHQRSTRPRSTTGNHTQRNYTCRSSILTLSESSSPSTPPASHHSHYHSAHLRKSYPGAESLELTHNSQLLHPSHRSVHDYIFRPVFRYSHRNSAPGVNTSCLLNACNCSDGCRFCLSNAHMIHHPAPQTLDCLKFPSISFSSSRSRRGSLDSCSRLGVGVALPPLKAQGDEGFPSSPCAELHALGHSMTKYPPRAADRRTGKTSLASASTRYAREPSAPTYPDPLTNGPPGYHRRLSQMAVLVSETIRWEKEKPKVKKKSKGSQGSL